MLIKKPNYTVYLLRDYLAHAIEATRFTAIFSEKGKDVCVGKVRLREAKPYCGSHPGACNTRLSIYFPVKRNRKAKYLEGLDWVAFDDWLNNVLDQLNISATVESAVCIIRKGTERRTGYFSVFDKYGNQEFTKMGADYGYKDYCGKPAPISDCTPDTPGEYRIYRSSNEKQSI